MTRICGYRPPNTSIFCYLSDTKLFPYDPIVQRSHARSKSTQVAHIPLHTLLSERKLGPRQRLSLAVHLASSVLQLHSTPWLSHNWFQEIMSFPLECHNGDSDPPYVQATLDHGDSSSAACTMNPYLVGLGILLLELSEQQPFEQRLRETGSVGQDLAEKAGLAWTWLDEIEEIKLGHERYRAVVDRCLRSTYTLGQANPHGVFSEMNQKAFYRGVIQELELIYNVIAGRTESVAVRG